MAILCVKCQYSNPETVFFCQQCRAKLVIEEVASGAGHLYATVQVPWGKLLGLTALAAVGFSSFYHLVWMNGLPVPVRRISVSLSEPMSDIQAISSMPWIAATSQYPLTVRALQEAGYLESDTARKARIEGEFQAEMDAQMSKLKREYGF